MATVRLTIDLVHRGADSVLGAPGNLDYLTVQWFGSFHDYSPPSPRWLNLQAIRELNRYNSVHCAHQPVESLPESTVGNQSHSGLVALDQRLDLAFVAVDDGVAELDKLIKTFYIADGPGTRDFKELV